MNHLGEARIAERRGAGCRLTWGFEARTMTTFRR